MSLQRKTRKQNLSVNEKLRNQVFLLLYSLKTQWFSSDWGSHRNLHTPNSTHVRAGQKVLFPLLNPTAVHKRTQAAELPSQIALALRSHRAKPCRAHQATLPPFLPLMVLQEDTPLPVLQSQLDLCPLLPPSFALTFSKQPGSVMLSQFHRHYHQTSEQGKQTAAHGTYGGEGHWH